jgi:hypothetical protein
MLRRDSESAKADPCQLCCGGESEAVQKWLIDTMD